jgi:hypothetical protein
MDGDRLASGQEISLAAEGRCQPTGGTLVCAGHWDHYGSYMVWTRHFGAFGLAYKTVPYDHPAPELIEAQRA